MVRKRGSLRDLSRVPADTTITIITTETVEAVELLLLLFLLLLFSAVVVVVGLVFPNSCSSLWSDTPWAQARQISSYGPQSWILDLGAGSLTQDSGSRISRIQGPGSFIPDPGICTQDPASCILRPVYCRIHSPGSWSQNPESSIQARLSLNMSTQSCMSFNLATSATHNVLFEVAHNLPCHNLDYIR